MPKMIRCGKCAHTFAAPSKPPAICPNCGKVFGPIRLVVGIPDDGSQAVPAEPDPKPIEVPRGVSRGKAQPAATPKERSRAKPENQDAVAPGQAGGSGPAFIWAFVGGGIVAVSILIGAIIQSSKNVDNNASRRQDQSGSAPKLSAEEV